VNLLIGENGRTLRGGTVIFQNRKCDQDMFGSVHFQIPESTFARVVFITKEGLACSLSCKLDEDLQVIHGSQQLMCNWNSKIGPAVLYLYDHKNVYEPMSTLPATSPVFVASFRDEFDMPSILFKKRMNVEA